MEIQICIVAARAEFSIFRLFSRCGHFNLWSICRTSIYHRHRKMPQERSTFHSRKHRILFPGVIIIN